MIKGFKLFENFWTGQGQSSDSISKHLSDAASKPSRAVGRSSFNGGTFNTISVTFQRKKGLEREEC